MKKLKILLCLLFCMLCIPLTSCAKGNQTTASTIEVKNSVKKNLPEIGEVFFVKVPKNQLVFKFFDYIKVDESTTWVVATDIGARHVIENKSVELEEGYSPVYYILLFDKDGKNRLYYIEIYRPYDKSDYTISFDTDGGSYCNSMTVDAGEYVYYSDLPIPKKDGYTFDGWDFSSQKINEDITIKAKWSVNNYTLSLNGNGVALNEQGDYQISTSITYDEDYTLQELSREGYIFLGWFDNYGTSTQRKVENGKYRWTNSVQLTAVWEKINYKINYNLDGGELDSSAKASYTIEDKSITLPKPTKTGYTFVGWTENEFGENPELNFEIQANSLRDYNVYAVWSANSYKVTFDDESKTVFVDELTIIFGNPYSLPSVTKEGYTLEWFEGSTKIESSGIWDIARNVVLKSKIYANTYTVTFNNVQEKEETRSVTFNYNYTGSTNQVVLLKNKEVLLYPTVPTRAGYLFTGWYTDSNCTSMYSFTGIITENKTLYAGWANVETTNDSSYSWTVGNGTLTSTNKGNNSSSTYKITAPCDMRVSFSYKTSSESGYDYFYIKKNGSQLKKDSGTQSSYTSYTVDLNKGDYLTFTYSKDSSQSSGNDCVYIKDLTYTSRVSKMSTATAVADENSSYIYKEGSTVVFTVTFDEKYELLTENKFDNNVSFSFEGESVELSGIWKTTKNIVINVLLNNE